MKFKDWIVIAIVAGVGYFAYQQIGSSPVEREAPPQENVFTPMTSSMGKAQNVEQIGMDRKAEMDQRLQEQTQ